MGKQPASGFVIWVNGPRRVGKAAVARELVQLLGENNTAVVDHNDVWDRPRHPAAEEPPRYVNQAKDAMLECILGEGYRAKTVICLGERPVPARLCETGTGS